VLELPREQAQRPAVEGGLVERPLSGRGPPPEPLGELGRERVEALPPAPEKVVPSSASRSRQSASSSRSSAGSTAAPGSTVSVSSSSKAKASGPSAFQSACSALHGCAPSLSCTRLRLRMLGRSTLVPMKERPVVRLRMRKTPVGRGVSLYARTAALRSIVMGGATP
jgi:hypothetical protein